MSPICVFCNLRKFGVGIIRKFMEPTRPLDRRNQPARRSDIPTPGYYKARLVRKGPYVACRIIETEDGWLLFIGGEPTGPMQRDPWRVFRMEAVAMYGQFIDRPEYDRMLAEAAAAPAGHPLRNPMVPVDLRASDPLMRKEAQ